MGIRGDVSAASQVPRISSAGSPLNPRQQDPSKVPLRDAARGGRQAAKLLSLSVRVSFKDRNTRRRLRQEVFTRKPGTHHPRRVSGVRDCDYRRTDRYSPETLLRRDKSVVLRSLRRDTRHTLRCHPMSAAQRESLPCFLSVNEVQSNYLCNSCCATTHALHHRSLVPLIKTRCTNEQLFHYRKWM